MRLEVYILYINQSFIDPVSDTHNKLFIDSKAKNMMKNTLACLWGDHRYFKQNRVKNDYAQ